jgi:hypothetical protein
MRTKIITIWAFLWLALPAWGQEFYYYGVNSRPLEDTASAITLIEVVRKSDRKVVIRTSRKAADKWIKVSKEKIRALNDREWQVYFQAEKLFSKKFYREYIESGPGNFFFKEYTALNTLRQGQTSRLFPLHLEGTLTDYYPNGKVKSISEYKNNQLVSNQNWLSDGTHYIDSIFYSADREPEFQHGNEFFKQYLLQNLSKSGWDLTQIQDQIVIGWVVMETGEMEGAVALQGKSDQLNDYLVKTVTEMPGKWQPATIDGIPVRYFMSIPVNFLPRDVRFQEVDFSAGRIHYNKY